MSVQSQQGAYSARTPEPEFPRHIVTAVLVAHDGARWLPDALAGLLGQTRPVQSVIACDTGSADDTDRLLTEALGADRVLHLARRTGFGAAVAEAVQTFGPVPPEELPYLQPPSAWDPVTRTWNDDVYEQDQERPEPVQWLWLLHDDCEPAPEALAELLRVADSSPSAGVIGPKVRSWYDRRSLLEVGVSIARSGRRWTGLERREQDQGQHDQVRQVLSVSSAGMLVRRDIWEELGGFDRRLPLMRDDVDFCWRAQTAGHTVLIAPEAVLRHAEAASRERRTVDCAGRSSVNPHRVDKAGAVFTLLANARGVLLPYVALRIILSTLLRTLGYLVGKVPGQALDEVAGLFGVLLRPGRILGARRRRGRPVVSPAELRPLFPPPGATLRASVEQVYSNLSGRSEPDSSSAGRHGGAVESGPGDDDADFLDVEQFARLKRIARKPAPMLFVVLLLVSLAACRGLLSGGALSGGALLPAPGGASDLWGAYGGAWHAVGTGDTQAAPPYLAVVALLSTVLLGSTSLALTLLLVCSVPLAGLSAYFASRPLVESRLLRAWGAVAYAFLPAATGALAAGRLGTAVLAILLPLMARAAVAAGGLQLSASAISRGVRPGWRASWAYALLLTITTAFTPVVWPVSVALAALVLVTRVVRGQAGLLVPQALRFLVVLATPLVVLAPWSVTLLAHPSFFLREAGLPYRDGAASALDLVMLSPGGPKASTGFLLAGLVLAGLAALLRDGRRLAIMTAWGAALAGLLAAALQNGYRWPGPTTLVYGLALIAAAAVGAEDAKTRISAAGFGWRQPVAGLIVLAAAAAPLIAAASWMVDGAAGPVKRGDAVQVPAFVAEESSTADQARTLVLAGDPGHVRYVLVRGSGARMGDGELAAEAGHDTRLDGIVANLVAGSGGDQSSQLSGYAVRYVLLQPGAPAEMGRVLDSTPGVTRLSQSGGTALWRLNNNVSRITITAPKGADGTAAASVPVASGKVEAHTTVPSGPAGRTLRVADSADTGWQATLDGKPLTATTVDGWAQGFQLPANGGRLDLTFADPMTHTVWLWAQGFLALVVLVLALPGRRRDVDDDLPEDLAAETAAIPAQATGGEGRRARRLRAAGEAAQLAEPAEPVSAPLEPEEEPEPYAAVPHQATAPEQDPYGAVPQVPHQQQGYEEWNGYAYPAAQPGEYDPYAGGQYQQDVPYPNGEYPSDQYPNGEYPNGEYVQYPDGTYQGGEYVDPYGYQQPPPPPPYDPAYDAGEYGHRRDGSDQQ
ncbi:glycosyltransferase family 2 protein [Streptantibioticus ferralitis]|uniref:Glycosyltransferase family 2 protein n=1 Tax=Streptantibioticus ferralitis TaxID=236510 RepID=A0ABT5Z9K7_9ACTN|nr:glycosyltransferase family 2 protein [Streptantibioticus ferralitis]MDF2260398.1 glycosyltransferase family 2 protein [Streptantibioticus ferralitis]